MVMETMEAKIIDTKGEDSLTTIIDTREGLVIAGISIRIGDLDTLIEERAIIMSLALMLTTPTKVLLTGENLRTMRMITYLMRAIIIF